ncbi:hypothetical protein BDP27DRAFT_1364321 [Rhodocollybia butyracea]|uniref:Uncharacterized protein n=1 Tax=Rhodocollybia butyracea TaxID=206335 RepID=A0A9P5PRM7_9AGAR|nr:hypothetical protein BDP27DRAFT_1364321 [Rhodocollybia butyracea]
MKLTTSLAALLSLASISVSSAIQSAQSMPSACQASERVLIETNNVTVSGKTIRFSKLACSADALIASRSLEKRQVLNSCDGCVAGPLTADCDELSDLLAASSELDEFFEVPPGFAETLTFGTFECGATLEYYFENLELLGDDLLPCTSESDNGIGHFIGAIGGFAMPTDFAIAAADTWTFEVLIT